MSKSSKAARQPRQSNTKTNAITTQKKQMSPSPSDQEVTSGLKPPPLGTGLTTRKTIEVPEDYFYRVKQRALDRRIKEKELWAEILYEYFTTHPTS